MFMHTHKDVLDITEECLSRRYVDFWPSCFHERAEGMVIDNLKRTVVLSHPADKFGPTTFNCDIKDRKKLNIPGFLLGVLAMTVSYLALSDSLKCSSD
jgi:hypothetical protein